MGEDISIDKLHEGLGRKFSSLQCDLKYPRKGQFCIVISPKNIVALEDPTPKFFVLVQESIQSNKPALELKLLTFHGKSLRSEIHSSEDLLLDSEILHSFDQGQFEVCQGMKNWSSLQTRDEILLEYFLDNVVLRSRSCEFLLCNRDSELCPECGRIMLTYGKVMGPSSKVDIKEEVYDRDDHDDDSDDHESPQMDFILETRLKEECDDLVLINEEEAEEESFSFPSKSRKRLSVRKRVDYRESLDDTYPENEVVEESEDVNCDDEGQDLDSQNMSSRTRKKPLNGKAIKVKKNTEKPLLQCESCDKCYKSNLSYVKHIKLCQGEETSRSIIEAFRCQVCLLTLGSQHTFNSHMELHKQKITLEGDTECPRCEKMCPKLELNSHFQADHDRTKGVCILCKTVCSSSFLEKHMKRKHFWKKHLCPECGREFDQLMKLSIHQATAHGTNEAPVVCDQCGKQFPHKERLRQHVGFFHKNSGNGEKPTCKYCGKTFASFHAMYKHKKTHSKVKPFQCRFCDYRAVFRSNVGVHLRKVHKQLDAKKEDVIRVGNFEYGDEEFPVSHDIIRPEQVPLSATPSHPSLAEIDSRIKPDLNPV